MVSGRLAIVAGAAAVALLSSSPSSSSSVLRFADAASYCSNYFAKFDCEGGRDPTANCRWIKELGTCVSNACISASYNETACAAAVPSCERFNQKCRSVNPCLAVKDPTKCASTGASSTSSPSDYGPLCTWSNATGCSLSCNNMNRNETACLLDFGSFCSYNKTASSCFSLPANGVLPTTTTKTTTTTAKPTSIENPCSIYATMAECGRNPNACHWVNSTNAAGTASGGQCLPRNTSTSASTQMPTMNPPSPPPTKDGGGNYCIMHTNADECRGDTAGLCTWVFANTGNTTSSSQTQGGGVCIRNCLQFGSNRTACSAFAPSCEFADGTCRVPDTCRYLSVEECASRPHCARTQESNTAAPLCRIRCEGFSGDYCSHFFGAHCRLEKSSITVSGTVCVNIPVNGSNVPPTYPSSYPTGESKPPSPPPTSYPYPYPSTTSEDENPTKQPCNGIWDQKACISTRVNASSDEVVYCRWATQETPGMCGPATSPTGGEVNCFDIKYQTIEVCSSMKPACMWTPPQSSGHCTHPPRRDETSPSQITIKPSNMTHPSENTMPSSESEATRDEQPTEYSSKETDGESHHSEDFSTTTVMPSSDSETQPPTRRTEPTRTTEKEHTGESTSDGEPPTRSTLVPPPTPTAMPTTRHDEPHPTSLHPPTKPTENPDTKPTEHPYTKPTENPDTKPTENPYTKPTENPYTKPTENPYTKPTEHTSRPEPTRRTEESRQTTTNAPTPVPTRVPPQCQPKEGPVISVDSTVNSTTGASLLAPYQRSQWIRITASVKAPYFACNTDVSGLVRLRWSVYNAQYSSTSSATYNTAIGSEIFLPDSAITVGPTLSIPPYTINDELDKIIVVRATYVGPSSTTSEAATPTSTKSWRVRMAPTAAPRVFQQGGDITVGEGKGFFLSAVVRAPCVDAADSLVNCAKSDDGLKPYVCDDDGNSNKNNTDGKKSFATECSSYFTWSCVNATLTRNASTSTSFSSSCGDAVVALLNKRYTTYKNVTILAAGTYNFIATYRSGDNVVSHTRVIKVVGRNPATDSGAPSVVPPSLSLMCQAARFYGQYGSCTAVADKQYRKFRWTVNGNVYGNVDIGATARFLSVFTDSVPSNVKVAIIDEKLNTELAVATFALPAAVWSGRLDCRASNDSSAAYLTSSVVSAPSGVSALGLTTTVYVTCFLHTTGGSSLDAAGRAFFDERTPSLFLSYLTRNANETVLSAVPTPLVPVASSAGSNSRVKLLSANFSFLAPPVNADISLLARVRFEGQDVAKSRTTTSISVSYTFTTESVRNLKERVEDSKASGDVNALAVAAAQLATAAIRNPDASREEKRSVASTVIGALASVVNTTASPATSSATTTMVTDAIVNAILASSRPASETASSSTPNNDKQTRFYQSTLEDGDKIKAAKALSELSSAAVAAGIARGGIDASDMISSLFTAADALAEVGDVTRNVSNEVVLALVRSALPDGKTVTFGGAGVRVAVTSFAATDSTSEWTAADKWGNGVRLPAGFNVLGNASSSSLDGTQVASLTTTTIPSSNNRSETATPPNAGQRFASAISTYNVYVGGDKVNITNRTDSPIFILVYVGNSSSRATSRLQIRFWDESRNEWRTLGLTTFAKCSDYKGLSNLVSIDETHVCGQTSHFTSFAAFSNDDDESDDASTGTTVAVIVGVVIAAVIVVAIATIVVLKMRGRSSRVKAMETEEYNFGNEENSVPLHELGRV